MSNTAKVILSIVLLVSAGYGLYVIKPAEKPGANKECAPAGGG